MITLRQIERQFGITIAPNDGSTRVSLYLKVRGGDAGERRQFLERELQNQKRLVGGLNKSRPQTRVVEDFFLRLANRLAFFDINTSCEGVAAFGDSKNLVVTMLPRLADSFVVVADSFHIRPLVRLPELFLRYVVVTLHGGHVAAYMRESSGTKMLFSYSPPVPELDEGGRADKKRRRNSMTLEYAARRLAGLSDTTLAVFGPRYLRTRFRKLLGEHHVRPPAFEGDADTSLEGLVLRSDRMFGQIAPPSAATIKEALAVASREGRLVTKLQDVLRAAAIGAVDTFVITTPDVLWSEAAVPTLRGQVEWAGSMPWTPRQLNGLDDCILDDVSETVLRGGGRVAELPLLRTVGTPAFAIVRWRFQGGGQMSQTAPLRAES
jgi:hypothetical protein